MKIEYKELIKTSSCKRKYQYIEYFFKNIVGTNQKPFIGKDENDIKNPFDIAIVRNFQEKKSRFGNKYIDRNWRTCIFYYIDKKDAFEYLNDSNKDNYKFTRDDAIISWDSTNGFPSSKINSTNLDTINYHVFRYFKTARSSWFVRSFVYFVLVICDDNSEISSKDFYIHYWNSNYKFKKSAKKPLFGKNNSLAFVENVSEELSLIKNENKDSLDCVKAYYGELDFFPESEEAYIDIKNDIDSGIEFILCQGAARTGKTILAMRFLHEYPEYKLLLMNYNFYLSLKDAFGVLNVTFPSNRIFHHNLKHKNGCWISGSINKIYRISLSNLIVDEAQRLGVVDERECRYGTLSKLDEIDDIVNCDNHVCTLFFGDDSQMLNPRYDQGFSAIKTVLGDKNYREYYFASPLGVPPEIIKNVRFLLGYENTSPHPINQFSILIEKDANKFVDTYLNDQQTKRHLVVPVIDNELSNGTLIGEHFFDNIKNKEEPIYLFDSEIQKEYFLTAYSVISREIESVYLFLPKNIYLSDDNQISIVGYSNNRFLINHLYTIMTRTTMNLYICCEDEALGTSLSEKIDAIKSEIEKDEDEDEQQQNDYDYDVFLSYFGTERKDGTYASARRICDLLTSIGLKVFLYNYSCTREDIDMEFSETWHAISRSKTLLFVFNEFVEKDSSGLIKRKTANGETSRIYQELMLFTELITLGDRKAKTDAKFYYVGTQLNKFTIYPFLNRYIPLLTQGNSNCCFMNDEELLRWINGRFSD
ncbi:MAG: DUF2075 domain-containing protein [Bacilli bacterium]|nr:DUF2075 domain-containing protein [Bacilli bacterium]